MREADRTCTAGGALDRLDASKEATAGAVALLALLETQLSLTWHHHASSTRRANSLRPTESPPRDRARSLSVLPLTRFPAVSTR